MRSTRTLDSRLVDDYLDLLNYAQQIGDIGWQQDILRTLQDAERHTEQAALEERTEALWLMYDAINAKMLELYRELRRTANAGSVARLTEEVWGLHVKRIEIGRQLYAAARP